MIGRSITSFALSYLDTHQDKTKGDDGTANIRPVIMLPSNVIVESVTKDTDEKITSIVLAD